MPALTLKDWHEWLTGRFADLRVDRDRVAPGLPLFALEHGLGLKDELPELQRVVRDAISRREFPKVHTLPFVVYAAEVGYRYEGDEYWPVFAAESPGWSDSGADRAFVRQAFERFADSLGAARPTGRWAKWFRNIAWPITHAILPTDLQRHLARLLADYRYALDTTLLGDFEELGQRLRDRAYDTSNRFQKFAENTSLLGLVAASLLNSDESAETPLLTTEVLSRIVHDLSRDAQANEWLTAAKRAAVRVRKRGLVRDASPSRRVAIGGSPVLAARFELRAFADGWTPVVTIPSFVSILERTPALKDEADRVRFRIAGLDQVSGQGGLLYGLGPVRLARWPTGGGSLVELENASDELTTEVAHHCVIDAPPLLFRLRNSGEAVLVRTRVVRPGQRYVLVELPGHESPIGELVAASISGMTVRQFDAPMGLDLELVQQLVDAGISVSEDLWVWPAGLTPSYWDGEGHAIWIAGETPTLGIRTSLDVARCVVSSGLEVTDFEWPSAGLAYIELTDSSIGTHDLEFTLVDDDGKTRVRGDFRVEVAEPPDSEAAAGSRLALQVRTTPAHASLPDLWTGQAFVVADGPDDERVRVDLLLRGRDSGSLLSKAGFTTDLPIPEARWSELFRGALGNSQLRHDYEAADEMEIRFSNDRLGVTAVRASRPFQPLRWISGADRSGSFVTLVDHTGADDLELGVSTARRPAEILPADFDDDGRVRVSDGGLVTARASSVGLSVGVIVPPLIEGGLESLAKLRVKPTLQSGPRQRSSLLALAHLAQRWTKLALAPDQIGRILQARVNDAILTRMGGLVGGERWFEVERASMDADPLGAGALARAAARHEGDERVGQRLIAAAEELAGGVDRVETFRDLAVPRSELPPVRLLLRLASVPGYAIDDPGVEAIIDLVLADPVLYRLARLFVLSSASAVNRTALEDGLWL